MKNTKSGIRVSREVITSIRTSCDLDTSCLTSSESIELMNRRMEENIGRCENLIEQGYKNIDHMIVGNSEQHKAPVKRKKLSI